MNLLLFIIYANLIDYRVSLFFIYYNFLLIRILNINMI